MRFGSVQAEHACSGAKKGEDAAMQVALTVWEGRISPLFDSTRMLLVLNVKGRRINDRHYEPLNCDSAVARAARLHELGVDVLICGGISNTFADQIEARGIKLIPFSSGRIEDVLRAYLAYETVAGK
jgi:predicted Fe-Mo cluster-binding NifX family protein